MNQSEELLNSEEVDFLLASGGDGNEESVLSDESAQEVTMRGDLDKMNLADIFQTLAMSKMEGMLRVRNPLEQREVFFRNGVVRCLVPARIETRRLGQRLIRAGFVAPEQLRSALLLQKKNGKPLGQVLIEEGVLDPEQIEEIAVAQITEDLYSLFTWGHGSFEFYRGATCDPVVQERLESLPEFEVNSVLLEVARRSDEWEGILDVVGSLDEVPIINDEIHEGPEELSVDCETIVNAIDGVLSIRELADACLMSLFDCARCAKDLYAWRVLVPASSEQLIDSVESWLTAGNMKRALVAVQTLYDRSDFKSRETILTMADQLRRCGESRLAARLVIEAASQEDLDAALELARTARDLAPRDAAVLAYLRAQLLEAGQESVEFLDVTMALAEAEQDEGNDEEALDLLDDLLIRYPDHQKVLFRKAVVLHRMKESKAAVNTLLHLAEMFKASQNDAKLIEVYEQILKVEYDNKDIARALKLLHAGKAGKVRRAIVVSIAIVIAAIATGYGVWSHMQATRVHTATLEVRRHLDNADIIEAKTMIDRFITELGEDYELLALREEVQELERIRKQREVAAEREELNLKLADAADLLERNEIDAALILYATLHDQNTNSTSVREIVNTRLQSVFTELRGLEKTLLYAIPEVPPEFMSLATAEARTQEIKDEFTEETAALVDGLLQASKRNLFPEWIDADLSQGLTSSAVAMRTILDEAFERLADYEAAVDRAKTQKRLNPLFLAAQEHERKHDFEAALTAYRTLANEQAGPEDLRAHFRAQVERYASILRYLEMLKDAAQNSDFTAARNQFRVLQRSYPEIPFETMVELPLGVRTWPPGADVSVDDRLVGQSPLTLTRVPARETEVRISMAGFKPEKTMVTGDEIGVVTSLLALAPTWESTTEGPVVSTPYVLDDQRAIVVDRSGVTTCLDTATGRAAWSFRSGDLSGFHPTPRRTADRRHLVLASLDGPLRVLDAQTGEVAWEVDNLPTECPPLIVGDRIYVVTTDEKVRVINMQTKAKEPVSASLSDSLTAPPIATSNRLIFVTSSGRATALDPKKLDVLWQTSIGDGALAAPLVTSRGLLFFTESGRITLVDPADGEPVWTRKGYGEILGATKTSRAAEVVVATRNRIVAINLTSGEKLPREDMASTKVSFSSAPALVGSIIAVGRGRGQMLLLQEDNLRLLCEVRSPADGMASAPAIELVGNRLLVCFEDQSVFCVPLDPLTKKR